MNTAKSSSVAAVFIQNGDKHKREGSHRQTDTQMKKMKQMCLNEIFMHLNGTLTCLNFVLINHQKMNGEALEPVQHQSSVTSCSKL